VLTVTATLLVALATFLFEDDDLLVLLVLEDGDLYGRTLDERSAEASIGTFADHEDFIDVDRVSRLRFREGIYFEDIAFSYGELATLCFNSGFHGKRGRANRASYRNQDVFSGIFWFLEGFSQ
jgi:hypothetical protein